MKHLTLTVPDNLDLEERGMKRFMAAKMYETGKLSLGQAADLAGLSKVAFAEILADYDVSLINYSPSEIARDEKAEK
jgi:predicted HTH domain antitoxin